MIRIWILTKLSCFDKNLNFWQNFIFLIWILEKKLQTFDLFKLVNKFLTKNNPIFGQVIFNKSCPFLSKCRNIFNIIRMSKNCKISKSDYSISKTGVFQDDYFLVFLKRQDNQSPVLGLRTYFFGSLNIIRDRLIIKSHLWHYLKPQKAFFLFF